MVRSGWETVGDAAIQASPGELVRRAVNYRTGRVGGPALLGAILTDAAEITEPGYRYGAGMITSPDGSLTHHGQNPGFETSFWISADRHNSCGCVSNCRIRQNTGGHERPSQGGIHAQPRTGEHWRSREVTGLD